MARKVLKAKDNQGTRTVVITDKEGNVKKEKSTYKSDGYKEKTKLKVKTKKDATSAPTATLTTIIKSKGSPKEKIVTKGDYDPVEQYVKPRKDLERNAAAMMKVKNPLPGVGSIVSSMGKKIGEKVKNIFKEESPRLYKESEATTEEKEALIKKYGTFKER